MRRMVPEKSDVASVSPGPMLARYAGAVLSPIAGPTCAPVSESKTSVTLWYPETTRSSLSGVNVIAVASMSQPATVASG